VTDYIHFNKMISLLYTLPFKHDDLDAQTSDINDVIRIRFGLNVQDTNHISGEENWRCDALSRLSQGKYSLIETLTMTERSDTNIVDLNDNTGTSVLLNWCDPRLSLDEEEVFLSFWNELQKSLDEFETHSTSRLHNSTSRYNRS
jgi:hypothetical protein